MTNTILKGFIVRKTDAAVAFIASIENGVKPFYIPIKKIASMDESDALDQSVTIHGESIARRAIPSSIEVDTTFLQRLGLA